MRQASSHSLYLILISILFCIKLTYDSTTSTRTYQPAVAFRSTLPTNSTLHQASLRSSLFIQMSLLIQFKLIHCKKRVVWEFINQRPAEHTRILMSPRQAQLPFLTDLSNVNKCPIPSLEPYTLYRFDSYSIGV